MIFFFKNCNFIRSSEVRGFQACSSLILTDLQNLWAKVILAKVKRKKLLQVFPENLFNFAVNPV